MHGKGSQQKEGWPTLTGSLKGSGSQVPSIVLLIVRGSQQLSQAEQQLSQRRQQMPSHHIQLEVLQLQQKFSKAPTISFININISPPDMICKTATFSCQFRQAAMSLVNARFLPSTDDRIRKQGVHASSMQITMCIRICDAAVHAWKECCIHNTQPYQFEGRVLCDFGVI